MAEDRRKLLSGKVQVAQVKSVDIGGHEIKSAGRTDSSLARVQHFHCTTRNKVYSRVENPSVEDTRQEDVLDSAVFDRDSESLRLFLVR